jgi:hypothetical protein
VSEQLQYKTPVIIKAMVFLVPVLIANSVFLYLGMWIWLRAVISLVLVLLLVLARTHAFKGLDKLNRKAVEEYHVKFEIFIGLYVFSFLPFYLGIFMTVQGTLNNAWLIAVLGVIINRLAWALPYLYPLVYGTLPRKLKIGIWVWIASGVIYGIAKAVLQ